MGLPQQQDPPAPSTTEAQPSQSTSTTTTTPKDSAAAQQLPPEALALATKLFDFARQGATAELSQYLSAGIPLNLTNHKGDTLLMLAAYYGHVPTVQMLLDKGADVNVLNDRGQSPIAGAVFKGYDEVVRAMVQKGADLYAGQPNAVESAMMFRRYECLDMFGVDVEGRRVDGSS